MNGIPTAQTSPLAASGQAEVNETAGAKFHTAMELFWTRYLPDCDRELA